MNICADSHDEIVFEGRACPLCEANQRILTLEGEVEFLTEEE